MQESYFDGGLLQLIGYRFLGMLVTVLTLGICLPWAYTENVPRTVTEEQAKTKLEMMEAEKRSEDAAVSFTLEEARNFTENHKWKFATTYAKTAPHEYLVKRWLNEEDRLLFERLVQTINEHAVVGYFYDHPNKYLILGDKYYWYMLVYPENMAVDLINRTTTDYLELRGEVLHYIFKQNV